MKVLEPRLKCQVLDAGEWLPGWVSAWARAADGSWRGYVQVTRYEQVTGRDGIPLAGGGLFPCTYVQVRPASQIRRAGPVAAPPVPG